MKNKLRILTLFLAITLIVSTMTIPAFAADETDPYNLIGEWEIKDYPSWSDIYNTPHSSWKVEFTCGSHTGSSISWNNAVYYWFPDPTSSESCYFAWNGNTWTTVCKHNTLSLDDVITVTGGEALTDYNFASYLKKTATQKTVGLPDPTPTPDSGTTEITFSKYNYCKLPDINSVWTDHDTYKAAAIIRIKDSGTYRLIIGADWINNYLYTEKYNGEDVEAYFLIGTDCMMYDLVGDVWTYVSTSSSGMYVRTATSDFVWANTLLYDDYTKEFAYTHFFSQPRLTTVMTQRGLSGVMTEILKLIPMTMACLVSYIALRKSWLFLLNLFQSA